MFKGCCSTSVGEMEQQSSLSCDQPNTPVAKQKIPEHYNFPVHLSTDDLIHAIKCREMNCPLTSCAQLKVIFMHTKNCALRSSGGCRVCASLDKLCESYKAGTKSTWDAMLSLTLGPGFITSQEILNRLNATVFNHSINEPLQSPSISTSVIPSKPSKDIQQVEEGTIERKEIVAVSKGKKRAKKKARRRKARFVANQCQNISKGELKSMPGASSHGVQCKNNVQNMKGQQNHTMEPFQKEPNFTEGMKTKFSEATNDPVVSFCFLHHLPKIPLLEKPRKSAQLQYLIRSLDVPNPSRQQQHTIRNLELNPNVKAAFEEAKHARQQSKMMIENINYNVMCQPLYQVAGSNHDDLEYLDVESSCETTGISSDDESSMSKDQTQLSGADDTDANNSTSESDEEFVSVPSIEIIDGNKGPKQALPINLEQKNEGDSIPYRQCSSYTIQSVIMSIIRNVVIHDQGLVDLAIYIYQTLSRTMKRHEQLLDQNTQSELSEHMKELVNTNHLLESNTASDSNKKCSSGERKIVNSDCTISANNLKAAGVSGGFKQGTEYELHTKLEVEVMKGTCVELLQPTQTCVVENDLQCNLCYDEKNPNMLMPLPGSKFMSHEQKLHADLSDSQVALTSMPEDSKLLGPCKNTSITSVNNSASCDNYQQIVVEDSDSKQYHTPKILSQKVKQPSDDVKAVSSVSFDTQEKSVYEKLQCVSPDTSAIYSAELKNVAVNTEQLTEHECDIKMASKQKHVNKRSPHGRKSHLRNHRNALLEVLQHDKGLDTGITEQQLMAIPTSELLGHEKTEELHADIFDPNPVLTLPEDVCMSKSCENYLNASDYTASPYCEYHCATVKVDHQSGLLNQLSLSSLASKKLQSATSNSIKVNIPLSDLNLETSGNERASSSDFYICTSSSRSEKVELKVKINCKMEKKPECVNKERSRRGKIPSSKTCRNIVIEGLKKSGIYLR